MDSDGVARSHTWPVSDLGTFNLLYRVHASTPI